MKEILNWLRSEIESHSVACGGANIINLHKIRTLINKAESKLEEDCCKWHPHGQYGWIIVSDHAEAEARNRDDIKNRPYCTVCGKRIKISEVE